MTPVDFEYDGQRMSTFGLVFGNIDGSPSDDHPLFSSKKVNSFKQNATNKNRLTNINYDDVLEIEFTMIKNPCDQSEFYLTDTEIRKIELWLTKNQYKEFIPLYDDSSFWDMCLYTITTQIKANRIGPHIAGLTVTMVANAPYGFTNVFKQKYQINPSIDSFTINPISDGPELIYPSQFVITIQKEGRFELLNSADPENNIIINNCKTGEVITLDCENKLITSDKEHKTLFKDFNYSYPRLVPNVDNIFTSDSYCYVYTEYQAIRKGGGIL